MQKYFLLLWKKRCCLLHTTPASIVSDDMTEEEISRLLADEMCLVFLCGDRTSVPHQLGFQRLVTSRSYDHELKRCKIPKTSEFTATYIQYFDSVEEKIFSKRAVLLVVLQLVKIGSSCVNCINLYLSLVSVLDHCLYNFFHARMNSLLTL
jgi:hypothetical protein